MSSRSRTNTPRRSTAERGTEQESGVAQRPISASAQRQAVGAIIRDANPLDRLSLRWAIVPVLDEEAELDHLERCGSCEGRRSADSGGELSGAAAAVRAAVAGAACCWKAVGRGGARRMSVEHTVVRV